MRILLGGLILLLLGCTGPAAPLLTLEAVARFERPLAETSGLTRWQQGFITHNDSGHAAELFMITPDGDITGKLSVIAPNHDWEAIAAHGNRLYVADTGNNRGRRQNLAILPLTRQHSLLQASSPLPLVYAEQTHFQPPAYQHNFDAEALTWANGQLWLFTKRWLDQKTALYQVPTQGVPKPLHAQQRLNPKMLVTGADFDPITHTLLLLGYSRHWWHRRAWIWLYPVQDSHIVEPKGVQFELSERGQFEGIALGQDGFIYVTREGKNTNLFRSQLSLTTLLSPPH